MDYLPQGLTQRLELNNTLPEPTLLRLGIEVSRALAFAHRAGVIHRDIKVDNILFDDHGNAIVVDFGIARAASDAARETKTNVVVGTPQYFAPEQARGRAVDGRTDIYALGVTLRSEERRVGKECRARRPADQGGDRQQGHRRRDAK